MVGWLGQRNEYRERGGLGRAERMGGGGNVRL